MHTTTQAVLITQESPITCSRDSCLEKRNRPSALYSKALRAQKKITKNTCTHDPTLFTAICFTTHSPAAGTPAWRSGTVRRHCTAKPSGPHVAQATCPSADGMQSKGKQTPAPAKEKDANMRPISTDSAQSKGKQTPAPAKENDTNILLSFQ